MSSFQDLWKRLRSGSCADEASPSSPASTSSSANSGWNANGSSKNSSDSDSNTDEDDQKSEQSQSQLLRLKRRAQTEKARAAALLARQKRKHDTTRISQHPAFCFKPDLQPRPEINKPGHYDGTSYRRRIRVVYSWFKAWCTSLQSILHGCGVSGNHVFSVNIIDDSNFVLAEVMDGAPNWRKSRVISVMNIVESLIVNYNHEDESTGSDTECCRAFGVCTLHLCACHEQLQQSLGWNFALGSSHSWDRYPAALKSGDWRRMPSIISVYRDVSFAGTVWELTWSCWRTWGWPHIQNMRNQDSAIRSFPCWPSYAPYINAHWFAGHW